MTYHVEEAAASLMVKPEELMEILEIFFSDAFEILSKCDNALKISDYGSLKSLFHNLKGSASNFRMNNLSELALTLEEGAKSVDLLLITNALPAFRKKLMSIQEQVNSYFTVK